MVAQSQPQMTPVKSENPPGPPKHWLWGNLQDFSRDRLGMLLEVGRQYGPVVGLRFLNTRAFLLTDPEDIKHLLVDNHRNYLKGYGVQALKPTLGEGLLTSEDEFHKRQRRLVQPAFHRQRIEAYAEIMTRYADEQMQGWRDGQEIDLHDEMMRLTMVIVARCLFDADVRRDAAHLGKAISDLIEQFDFNRIGPIGQFINRFDRKLIREREQRLRVLDELLYDLIRARRAEGKDHGDLLSMILNAQDSEAGADEAKGMTDKQARDELITLFIAGHETTAIALTFTFYLLAQNQEVETKLLAELDSVLGAPGTEAARLPTEEELARLPYARQVFAEAMRLYPPAFAVARTARGEDVIRGYRIRKGDSMIASQWVTHRDPQWWPDPERFDPERFTPAAEAGRPKFAYFPFGGGPRRCVGEPFAWMEGHLLLATIAHRYRMRVQPGYAPKLEPRVTLRPRHGMPMRLERRGQDGFARDLV